MKKIKIQWTDSLRNSSKRLHDPYLVRSKKKFYEIYGKEPNTHELIQYTESLISTSLEMWSELLKEAKKQNANNTQR
jgi:hypothetical protein